MKAAIYARVSTTDQTCENQLVELRRYVDARGWTGTEFVDRGVSGSKENRPALDALLLDARRRKFDTVVVWALDRAGRNLKHLITLIEELHELGIAFVSLREGLDLSTASGRLQFHVLASLAAFERERLRERTIAGLQRARSEGQTLGRPRVHPIAMNGVDGLSVRAAASLWNISKSTAARWMVSGRIPQAGDRAGQTPVDGRRLSPEMSPHSGVRDGRTVSGT